MRGNGTAGIDTRPPRGARLAPARNALDNYFLAKDEQHSERRGAGRPAHALCHALPVLSAASQGAEQLTGTHFDCPTCHFSLLALSPHSPRHPPRVPTTVEQASKSVPQEKSAGNVETPRQVIQESRSEPAKTTDVKQPPPTYVNFDGVVVPLTRPEPKPVATRADSCAGVGSPTSRRRGIFQPSQADLVEAAEEAYAVALRGDKLASVGMGTDVKPYIEHGYSWGSIRVSTVGLSGKDFPFRYKEGSKVGDRKYEVRDPNSPFSLAMPFHQVIAWKAWLLVTLALGVIGTVASRIGHNWGLGRMALT